MENNNNKSLKIADPINYLMMIDEIIEYLEEQEIEEMGEEDARTNQPKQ